ncbi:uncharacterized protein LOC124666116 [Lolium rigidum]|uniref:uncharacterized protein LOC124666116 n=1 Tax=Lolium rigidum TaxID=89674 RepID=UPI001F5DFD89|nr:uncharacterized protein LOC124666116 [Lolium rigidum]
MYSSVARAVAAKRPCKSIQQPACARYSLPHAQFESCSLLAQCSFFIHGLVTCQKFASEYLCVACFLHMCEVKFGPNARGVQMVELLGSLYRANTVHQGTAQRATDIEASQQQRVWLVLLVIQLQNDTMNDFMSTEVDIGRHRTHTSAIAVQNRSVLHGCPGVQVALQAPSCSYLSGIRACSSKVVRRASTSGSKFRLLCI